MRDSISWTSDIQTARPSHELGGTEKKILLMSSSCKRALISETNNKKDNSTTIDSLKPKWQLTVEKELPPSGAKTDSDDPEAANQILLFRLSINSRVNIAFKQSARRRRRLGYMLNSWEGHEIFVSVCADRHSDYNTLAIWKFLEQYLFLDHTTRILLLLYKNLVWYYDFLLLTFYSWILQKYNYLTSNFTKFNS